MNEKEIREFRKANKYSLKTYRGIMKCMGKEVTLELEEAFVIGYALGESK